VGFRLANVGGVFAGLSCSLKFGQCALAGNSARQQKQLYTKAALDNGDRKSVVD
jgi:hypothetical protein